MKIGDLILSKAFENHKNILPAKLVIDVKGEGKNKPRYVVTDDAPEEWKLARSFFVVSRA